MELIIKPTDSLNLVWSGNKLERLLFDQRLYKYCSYAHGHWVIVDGNFGPEKKHVDRLKSWCKSCRKVYFREQRQRQKERPYYLDIQDNICGICPTDLSRLPTKQIHVDHNHRTGVTRGALCRTCNLSSGGFNADECPQNMFRGYLWKLTDGRVGEKLAIKDKLMVIRDIIVNY